MADQHLLVSAPARRTVGQHRAGVCSAVKAVGRSPSSPLGKRPRPDGRTPAPGRRSGPRSVLTAPGRGATKALGRCRALAAFVRGDKAAWLLSSVKGDMEHKEALAVAPSPPPPCWNPQTKGDEGVGGRRGAGEKGKRRSWTMPPLPRGGEAATASEQESGGGASRGR
jgi:hypothetical protein